MRGSRSGYEKDVGRFTAGATSAKTSLSIAKKKMGSSVSNSTVFTLANTSVAQG